MDDPVAAAPVEPWLPLDAIPASTSRESAAVAAARDEALRRVRRVKRGSVGVGLATLAAVTCNAGLAQMVAASLPRLPRSQPSSSPSPDGDYVVVPVITLAPTPTPPPAVVVPVRPVSPLRPYVPPRYVYRPVPQPVVQQRPRPSAMPSPTSAPS